MTGAAGGIVSTVTSIADDAGPGLPAVSVALAVKLYVPSDSADDNVSDQAPVLSAVVVPRSVEPSNTWTVASFSAVPVIVVISVLRVPASGSVMTGAAGGIVSTVTSIADDAGPGLPAVSVALAVKLYVPSDSADDNVSDQAPVLSAVVVTKIS